MITAEVFLLGLTLCATMSGLVTEAVKKTFVEFDKKVGSTALAAICSTIVAIAVSVLYLLYTGITVDAQVIAAIIVFVILSWIGSTVGYDKVKQALESFYLK